MSDPRPGSWSNGQNGLRQNYFHSSFSSSNIKLGVFNQRPGTVIMFKKKFTLFFNTLQLTVFTKPIKRYGRPYGFNDFN